MRICRIFFLIFAIFLFVDVFAQKTSSKKKTTATKKPTTTQTQTQAVTGAGKVVAVTGTVTAGQRTLSRGSIVSAGETVTVGANGKVQILLNDGTVFNLVQNTSYQINTFNYTASNPSNPDEKNNPDEKTKKDKKTKAQAAKKPKTKPSFLARLIRGGLEKLTGKIAEENPSGYQDTSRVATIGIRGTVYETAVDPSQQNQALGVYDGTTTFTNRTSGTTVNVGNQGTQRYASANTAGQTITTPDRSVLLKQIMTPNTQDLLRDLRQRKREVFLLEESASVSGSYPSNQGPDANPFTLSNTTIEASALPPGVIPL